MMTKGFLKETNFRGSSYFEINLAWQYISYMNIVLLFLLKFLKGYRDSRSATNSGRPEGLQLC